MNMLARPPSLRISPNLRQNVVVHAAPRGKGKAFLLLLNSSSCIFQYTPSNSRANFPFLPIFAGSQGGGGGRGGGGAPKSAGTSSIPPWKRYQKKGFGKQAEATLETIWMRTQWPSDETVAGMWTLHRLRREQVLTWFQEKRRVLRGGSSRSGSSSSSSSKEGKEKDIGADPATEWDAEWEILGAESSEDDDDEDDSSGDDDDDDDE